MFKVTFMQARHTNPYVTYLSKRTEHKFAYNMATRFPIVSDSRYLIAVLFPFPTVKLF